MSCLSIVSILVIITYHVTPSLTNEQHNSTLDSYKGLETQTTDESLSKILEALKPEEFCLVKFYAKWCSFSQQLEPVYATLPRAFPTLPIFSIDASKYYSLNSKFGIYAFPRILLFTGKNYTRYAGNRTFESLSGFITEHTKLEPVPGVHVELPKLQPNAEADIYLYLSSSFLLVLLGYTMWAMYVTKGSPAQVPGTLHAHNE